jgi:hypothetical protein
MSKIIYWVYPSVDGSSTGPTASRPSLRFRTTYEN